MGFVFNAETTKAYDWWLRSSQGQYHLEHEFRLIERLLEPQSGETILDVGCGPGFHLRWFQECGMKPTGIDASAHMVELARQRVGYKLPVFQGFAENLPFPDHHFDTVALITTLEFVDSPLAAITEAFRTAKKKVLVLILNRYSLLAVGRQIQSLFKNTFHQQGRLLNVWELKRMIRKVAGLGQLQWDSVLSVPAMRGDQHSSKQTAHSFHSPFGAYVAACVKLAVPVCETKMTVLPSLVKKTPSWAHRAGGIRL
jgi:ubiquinone/menaquinone biosynthesis C-methylase UbiE